MMWFMDGKKLSTTGRTLKRQDQEKGKPAEIFTHISEIDIDADELEKGTKYTCRASHESKNYIATWSSCKAHLSAKPLIHLEKPRLSDPSLRLDSAVTASCVVEAALNSSISWVLNGQEEKKTSAENKDRQPSSNTEHTVSNLTLTAREWEQLHNITCRVKQPCDEKPEEKTVNGLESAVKDPKVEIRRPLGDVPNGDSAVLECSARDVPSGELFVTFHANQNQLDQAQYVDLPKGQHSLTARIIVPVQRHKKDDSFTCKVHQSPSKYWTSQSTGKIFGDPSVELLLVPSAGKSEPQKLLCTGTGFKPEIKWIPNSGKRPDVPSKAMIQADGRMKVFSEMDVSLEEWNEGKEFICQVTDLKNTAEKNTSACAAHPSAKPLIHLEKPRLSDPSLRLDSAVTASCVVEAALNSSISWVLNGQEEKKTSAENKDRQPSSNTEHTVSNLTLTAREWEQLHNITCRVKQPCDEKPEEKTVNGLESAVKDPKVEIRRPLGDVPNGDAVLECSARDVPSGELFVTFHANQNQLDQAQYVDLPKGQHSLTARIIVPVQRHKKDDSFTCKVHQSPSKYWTSQSTGKIFGDPSVELLLVPSAGKSEPQKLLCTGTGFKPEIKWIPNSGKRPDVPSKAMIQADGRMKVFSEMDVSLEEWNEGKEFICQVTDLKNTAEKNTSACAAHPSAKPLIHLEKPRLSDPSLRLDSAVTASCVVEAALNSSISWVLNGQEEKKTSAENKDRQPSSNTEHTVSNLTLTAREWEQLHNITCRVKQPCDEKPEEKTVNGLESAVKDPKVEIRRPLGDVPKDGAVLECSARDVPSGELFVTFHANQNQLDQAQHVDLPKGQHSLTARIIFPVQRHKKDDSFTCKVQQSPSKYWTSQSTGKIFGDPSVELLLVPSAGKSEPQKLLCIGTGFKPEIKWLPNSGKGPDVPSTAMIQADGRMKVFSEMDVSLEEWNKGKEFTCQVTDLRETIKKNISACAVTAPFAQLAQVYLLGPSLSDMRSADRVPLTCLVTGHRVKDFSITWKIDKVIQSQDVTTEPPKDHANGTQSVKSILKLPASRWNAYAEVSCEVSHLCSSKTEDHNIVKVREPKSPTVRILSPSDSDLSASHNPTLLCLITGFYPADISVHWELDQKRLDVSRFTNSPVGPHSAGRDFSMHSALTLLASGHEHGTFSCVVNHQSSSSPIISTLDNLYASVTETKPSVKMLQARDELVCLVYGYSPSAINITWLLDGVTIARKHNITSPAKGPDGKFNVKSQLQVLPSEWPSGSVYTCQVMHITGTINRNISKAEIIDQSIYFDENMSEATTEDMAAETWNMACAFIALFLVALIYGFSVTLVRVKVE